MNFSEIVNYINSPTKYGKIAIDTHKDVNKIRCLLTMLEQKTPVLWDEGSLPTDVHIEPWSYILLVFTYKGVVLRYNSTYMHYKHIFDVDRIINTCSIYREV